MAMGVFLMAAALSLAHGEQGNQPQGEGEQGLWDYLPSAVGGGGQIWKIT